MNRLKIITGLMIGCAIAFGLAACGSSEDGDRTMEVKTLHVSAEGDDNSGDGTEESPFATIDGALGSGVGPGSEIIVHEGTYGPVEITGDASGTPDRLVTIRAAEGEKPLIKQESGKLQSGEDGLEDAIGIHLIGVSNVTIKGFEISGGTHGIMYETNRDHGKNPFDNVTIEGCEVHDIVGTHGIAVYAGNDLAPVKDLTVKDCQVYDCLCGDSESLVLNGNIDGFRISGNVIHDNNNIGIDMIGFEGTAEHPEGAGYENLSDEDFARNGRCTENIVYNISAEGNPAYLEDGEYDLCADGIYVDGGQDIEIDRNFVFNCDIGLEVATEHSPDDNELFKVSGVKVHDNVVADCQGWCGFCFGGYDRDLGFTEECEFANNTFVDNATQLGVQRSKCNDIRDNLFVGGEDSSAIEFNGDCRQRDLINDFEENTWCIGDGDLDEYIDTGGHDRKVLISDGVMKLQRETHDRNSVLDGFSSKATDAGSSFAPDKAAMEIYRKNKEAQ